MTLILAAVAWLLTYLLHSTVLLAGAFTLVALGVVRSVAARDTLWKVALVGGLVTATAQTALRLQPWAGHVAIAGQSQSSLVDVAGVRDVRVVPSAPESTPAGAAFASAIAQRDIAQLPAPETVRTRTIRRLLSGVHVSWPALLLNLWLVAAAFFCARLVWHRLSLSHRLRWRRIVADGPLATTLAELSGDAGVSLPRLSVSDRLAGPIAFGREICVPERVVTSLAPSEQRAVLAHELGHVVRNDPAWLVASAIIECLFFFQPLNRFARRRLRETSEYLCDDWAAERTDGVVLARCLAEVAGWVKAEPAPVAVASMAGHCSMLVHRVERLLQAKGPSRPARWVIRAGAGALALSAVAVAVPGVAAEDFDRDAAVSGGSFSDVSKDDAAIYSVASWDGTSWATVREDGHLIVFAPGWAAKFTGTGKLGFRQYGRAIAIPDDYTLSMGGRSVTDDVDLCTEGGAVRLVGPNGAWDVTPVRVEGAPSYAYSEHTSEHFAERTIEAVRQATRSLSAEARADLRAEARADARADSDADVDVQMNGEADAAIDTLVQLWVRDPEAVRRAAHRIARTYDRDLRPQFESLGVQLGRDLAPQLQRLTGRVGRDLSPEFARLGAELGASILSSLTQPETYGTGSDDWKGKRRPKGR